MARQLKEYIGADGTRLIRIRAGEPNAGWLHDPETGVRYRHDKTDDTYVPILKDVEALAKGTQPAKPASDALEALFQKFKADTDDLITRLSRDVGKLGRTMALEEIAKQLSR